MGVKIRFFLISILIISLSCRKDDNNPIAIEEADRTEQQVIDNDSLLGYFNSHYISNSILNNESIPLDEIMISPLPEDGVLPNADQNSLLIDVIETYSTTYLHNLIMQKVSILMMTELFLIQTQELVLCFCHQV